MSSKPNERAAAIKWARTTCKRASADLREAHAAGRVVHLTFKTQALVSFYTYVHRGNLSPVEWEAMIAPGGTAQLIAAHQAEQRDQRRQKEQRRAAEAARPTGFAAVESADDIPAYFQAQRAVAHFREAMIGDLRQYNLDELEGLVQFINQRIRHKRQLQKDVAAMSADELDAALSRLSLEIDRRKAERQKDAAKSKTATEAVDMNAITRELTRLAEACRGIDHG
ncbi:MAG: hypothetical protein K8S97_08485 [Anaerolineae bacterium]|nr:hypothetical protein [Anaerolineae bacterium]